MTIDTSSSDRSAGYEVVAERFIAYRSSSAVGAATVRAWAAGIPVGGAVLDLGCGSGLPISQTLVDAGFAVHGIDASPAMVAAFRVRFPRAPVECGPVENSTFFGRLFDGAVAWGLMFLLAPDTQASLIRRVAAVLRPGGLFAFTAPREACEWADSMTGRISRSLGEAEYRRAAEAAGLRVVGDADDEGQNHYYFLRRRDGAPEG